MHEHFKADNFTHAVVHGINQAGELLAQHFRAVPTTRTS